MIKIPRKKVTVDAVADIRYTQPTRANQNTGDADGTDSVKFKSYATVNYLLEDDNSKLKRFEKSSWRRRNCSDTL